MNKADKDKIEKVDFNYKLSSGETLPIQNFNLKDSIKVEALVSKPCQIHKTENNIYCFNCSKAICNYCRVEHHDHVITMKNNFLIKPALEKALFSKIDTQVKNSLELCYPKKLYDFFYDKLDKHFKNMTENLERYRVQRLKELHILFEDMESSAKEFNSNYKRSKTTLSKFVTEGKTFFPSNYFSEIVFLQMFNIVNNGMINEKRVLEEVKKTKQKTVIYEEELTKSLSDIELIFKNTLNKGSSLENIISNKLLNPFEEFNKLIEENHVIMEKFNIFVNANKKKRGRNNNNLGISSNSVLDFSTNNYTHNIGMKNMMKNSSKLMFSSVDRPKANQNINDISKTTKKIRYKEENSEYSLLPNKSNYNSNMFKGNKSILIEKEEIALDKFTNLKIYETAYVSYLTSGELKFQKLNFKESSQIEKIMEASTLKNNASMNKLTKNMNVYLNPQNKMSYTYSASNQLLNLLKVYAEVNYNKSKLETFEDIGNINNNIDSNIANSPLRFLEEEGYDSFQAVSGTNKVEVYDFKSKKPYQITVFDLNSKEHDYNIFPYGCRSFYLEDKIYIFGGKDWDKQYKTILLYETTTCKISKIGEMKHSRSYHSINYSHDNSLYIIGGENSNSCEMFSFSENKSYLLPSMEFTRANCSLFNYRNEYLYVFCGYKQTILDKEINNSFERLNISQPIVKVAKNKFSTDWEKVNINNKAQVELPFEYIGLMPYTDSHVLMYGGYDKRSFHRSIVCLDLIKHKIIPLEDKEFLELRDVILEDEKFTQLFDKLIHFK